MCGDGVTSTEWSSTITMRGAPCAPVVRVAAAACEPERKVTRFTYSLDDEVEVSRTRSPRRSAICGTLT